MDDDEVAATGSLFRLASDLKWQTLDTGYRITNGPAFSVDGTRMYHTDSALRRVYVFDLSSNGEISQQACVPADRAWPGLP